jgi:hypothetical protein
MPDPKSRARVQRLLSGTFRPDDLTGLFLYARDHCDGRESVAEIGHFVAHHNERDRGIVTRSTRDWFAMARFHMPRFQNQNAAFDDPKKCHSQRATISRYHSTDGARRPFRKERE